MLVIALSRQLPFAGPPLGRGAGNRVATCTSVVAAAGSADGDGWREAYELQLERNRVLREQLDSLGLTLEPGVEDELADLEACTVDWAGSYDRLSACNDALAARVGGRGRSAADFEDKRDVDAKAPASFEVLLPGQQSTEVVELQPFYGRQGVFYAVTVRLPLGTKLTKGESGDLLGAFVVEEILPGGSAEACGQIQVGDVLHALTVVMDRSDLGMKTEDFVSSVVGGFGRFRQSIQDTYFVDTAEDVAELLKSNLVLGADTELTLVLERNVAAESAVPARPLSPARRE